MPFSNLVRFPSANIQVPQANFSPINIQPNYNKARALQAAFSLIPELVNQFGPEAKQRQREHDLEYRIKEQQYKNILGLGGMGAIPTDSQGVPLYKIGAMGQKMPLSAQERQMFLIHQQTLNKNQDALNQGDREKHDFDFYKSQREAAAQSSQSSAVKIRIPEVKPPPNWNPDASIYAPAEAGQSPSIYNVQPEGIMNQPVGYIPDTSPQDWSAEYPGLYKETPWAMT